MKLFRKHKASGATVEGRVIDENAPFAIREAYKSLYTSIVYLSIEDKCKKIAVTSAIPSEGKSTVSANLACTIAQNSKDKRVLLIDSDMRLPKISKMFSLDSNASGLSEYLAGVDEAPNFIYLPDKKLTVLSAGGYSVNPTQLISSSAMGKLFELCEEQFDYVIIDTPPVNVVTDAILINNYINGYVLAILADHSDVNNITNCVERLNQVGAEIYGFVLSGVRLKGGSGRYKYSNYSKSYSSSERK